MKKPTKDSMLKYLATFYLAVFLRALYGPLDIVDVVIIAVSALLVHWLLNLFKR